MRWVIRQFSEHRVASIIAGICLVAVIVVVLIASKFSYSLFRWKAHIWVQEYFATQSSDAAVQHKIEHIIFVMVDHYEQGRGEKAVAANKEWCKRLKSISDRFYDEYGNKFKYTWFYPYDHRNEEVLKELSKMAYNGYGEIELHWHLDKNSGVTNDTFGDKLREAIRWYQGFGAMITERGDTSFGYIAGNWDLDASRSKQLTHGITNQIEQLFNNGCYADFTFSTIGTVTQPKKVNSIYYVIDDPKMPKSYNTGENVSVRKVVGDKLMIFQGPILISLLGDLEYGAVENGSRFKPERVDAWVKANVHVHGRPEWIFIKAYTHGAQSAEVLFNSDLELMIGSLKKYCKKNNIHLHFMSAREAYNIVKAAEAGKIGNPENYKNFKIPIYQNMNKLF